MKPDTIARSLAIGAPADGFFALKVARAQAATSSGAPSSEIREGIGLLASTEGVFTETAGGVTIANLKRMAEQGIIEPGEEVVAYVTGNGYKTIEALEGFLEASYPRGARPRRVPGRPGIGRSPTRRRSAWPANRGRRRVTRRTQP